MLQVWLNGKTQSSHSNYGRCRKASTNIYYHTFVFATSNEEPKISPVGTANGPCPEQGSGYGS